MSGEVSRDLLSVSTKYSLGAISTLFLLPPEAAAEIESFLIHKQKPESLPLLPVEEEITQVDELL